MHVGDVVADRYEVRRVLEVGDRSTVLEAVELAQDRFVVIELFRRFRVEQVHERFQRELRRVAALRSEHVARVLGSGCDADGSHYVVTETREGESLEAVLRRHGPLPPVRVVELMLQVCDALDEAHAAQLVHQDLSPETLFLTRRPDGSPCMKIRDFGARLATHAITAGRMLGTAHFTAPEQLASAPGLDARTDVWALGATIYELSTGHRPFEQAPAQLEAALLTRDPTPLGERRPGLPAAFSEVVMRCLARSPSARYESVVELADAIAPYGPGQGHGVARAVRGVLAAGATRLRSSTERMRHLVRTRRW